MSNDMRYMECTGTPHDLGIFKWDYVTNIQNGIPNKELEPNYITTKKGNNFLPVFLCEKKHGTRECPVA